MAIRHFKKGTGITTLDWEKATGEDVDGWLKKRLRAWNEDYTAGGESVFGAGTLYASNLMRAIKNQNGSSNHEDDSDADFAQRFLNSHDQAMAALERIAAANSGGRDSAAFRDADHAARSAWRAGVVYTMHTMKVHHESDAQRGQKNAAVLGEARDAANRRRKNTAHEKWAEVQTEADRYFLKSPGNSKRAAAMFLKNRLKLTDEIATIADRITKKV